MPSAEVLSTSCSGTALIESLSTFKYTFSSIPPTFPRKAALDNAIGSALKALQTDSDAALESFDYALSQTPREAVTGIANLTLSLKVIGELRRIIVNVSLSL